MRISAKARMNRLFNNGGCLDVAVDHGVCNEPSFLAGLEDMPRVIDTLVAARPDAIQMAYGQADLLQQRPERDKPALVMRIDMGNPYNSVRHRVMWCALQNHDEPLIGALEMDAACVVVNLFMLPDEPDLFRQCVENISRVRADCHRYGMPLMIEPLVMATRSMAMPGRLSRWCASRRKWARTSSRRTRPKTRGIFTASSRRRECRCWYAAAAGKI
jgi:class I fructose-bisphosphate aldolase